MASETPRLSITELEAQISQLSAQVNSVKVAAKKDGFSQGDCTNGCTFGCTGECTKTCVFEQPGALENPV